MPANKQRVDNENAYYHIYNRGREGKTLFNDPSDFSTFIGYLNEYLTLPSEAPAKKVFTVSGKTFHGVPHLPKNYHKKLELVAYSLIPDSFSLLVKQIEKGTLESFIRSISTRYSIYFNKKYQRTGQLFDGQCKSKHLENDNEVSLLTYYLHRRGGQSSIDKYLYHKLPEWLSNRPDIASYPDFVQKYELNEEQQEVIKHLTFNTEPQIDQKQLLTNVGVAQTNSIDQKTTRYIKIHQRIPELVFDSTLFLTLLTFGLINVNIYANDNQQKVSKTEKVEQTPVPIDNPKIAGLETESLEETSSAPNMLVVRSGDPLITVSIYKDIYKSEEIVRAGNGAKLELVSKGDDWCQIKLADGTTGFIETKYTETVKIEEINTL